VKTAVPEWFASKNKKFQAGIFPIACTALYTYV
jgi:hypothetical protein